LAKKKRIRMATLDLLPHVVQDPQLYRGSWRNQYFKGGERLVLELGCGKAELSLALAVSRPCDNHIGIDLKGARLWVAAANAQQQNLRNIAFTRLPVQQVADCFAGAEVDEIWLPFPDPFPKKRQQNRRMTSPYFLSQFARILSPGARLHLKTDDKSLYDYSLETLKEAGWRTEEAREDLYADPPEDERLSIRTTYEVQHLKEGKKIKYIRTVFQG